MDTNSDGVIDYKEFADLLFVNTHAAEPQLTRSTDDFKTLQPLYVCILTAACSALCISIDTDPAPRVAPTFKKAASTNPSIFYPTSYKEPMLSVGQASYLAPETILAQSQARRKSRF